MIQAAVSSRAIEWYSRRENSPPEGAAAAMDKKLEEFGLGRLRAASAPEHLPQRAAHRGLDRLPARRMP